MIPHQKTKQIGSFLSVIALTKWGIYAIDEFEDTKGLRSMLSLVSVFAFHRFIGILSKLRNFHCKNYIKKSLKIAKGGNQNPYIEEEQTKQWPKEKEQTDKQRTTKTYT